MSDVIAWIEAAHPADPGHYHTATRDGATASLGNDIAFTAQASKVACMTDSKHTAGALACLVTLTNPPPRPRRPTANGKAAGSTSTERTCRSGRPAAIRARSSTATDPSWRTGTRCHSVTTVAAPTNPACSA